MQGTKDGITLARTIEVLRGYAYKPSAVKQNEQKMIQDNKSIEADAKVYVREIFQRISGIDYLNGHTDRVTELKKKLDKIVKTPYGAMGKDLLIEMKADLHKDQETIDELKKQCIKLIGQYVCHQAIATEYRGGLIKPEALEVTLKEAVKKGPPTNIYDKIPSLLNSILKASTFEERLNKLELFQKAAAQKILKDRKLEQQEKTEIKQSNATNAHSLDTDNNSFLNPTATWEAKVLPTHTNNKPPSLGL